jgi:phospholipase C
LSFFRNGLEENWNKQQYLQCYLSGHNLTIKFRDDFAALYGISPFVYEIKPYLDFNNIYVKKVNLNMEIRRRMNNVGVIESCPVVTARIDISGGDIKYSNQYFDITLFHVDNCSLFIRFYLVCRGDISGREPGDMQLVPEVDAHQLLNQIPLGDYVRGKINEIIDQTSKKLFSTYGTIAGEFLRPWFAGGDYKLVSISYAPNPNDQSTPDGTIFSPRGELIVKYIGPRQADPNDVVPTPHPNEEILEEDSSSPLFDFPFEEHIRIKNPPFGFAPYVPNNIENLKKINHIVVLMQENRSFDQVLGYLSREGIRGYLHSNEIDQTNPATLIDDKVIGLAPDDHPDRQRQVNFFPFNPQNAYYPLRADETRPGSPPARDPPVAATAWPAYYLEGPAHGADDVAQQIDIDSDDEPNPINYDGHKMGGFVRNYAKRLQNANSLTPENLRLIMDYYTDKHLKIYGDLAKQFGICDQWFTSFAGGTIPNRYVTHTGKLNRDPLGNIEEYNPEISKFFPSELPTIFEYLTKYGIKWKVFEHGYSFTRFFGAHTFDTEHIVPFYNPNDPLNGFESIARRGELPDVTWIEPDYIELPPGNDDHAPADMKDGQDLVYRIVRALIDSPQWPHTLLIITYDEHGGFYDHIVPPNNDEKIGIIGSRNTLGPRVPTFVISPLIKPGRVFHRVFDHTSIGATIIRRFCERGHGQGYPEISERLDHASDLRMVLELDEPRTEFGPFSWNIQARTIAPPDHNPIKTNDPHDDFHWLLEIARLITGQPLRRAT